MKEKKMSEPRLSGLNDEQDVGKSKILKSSNHANPDSDNMKQGWEIKKLGEIGKVSMCKRVFKEDTTPEGDIPFYKIGTFGKTPDAFISKERYNEFRSKFSFPKKGDILISASGTIGRRVRYDGEPAYFQDSNIVWIDNNEKLVLNDYLYRFYEICNWGASKGATISRLYNDNLKQIEIPFPKSIQEQQYIVSILDEAFAAIAKAKANAEQNLKNAKELFESYLQGVFENGNWEKKKLQDVAKVFGRGKSKHRPRNWEGLYGGKYPFIQTGEVRNANKYISNYSQTYNQVGLAQSKLWKKGTICITIAANIAETAILDFDACIPDSIIGFEVDDKKADLNFAYYLLQYFKAELQKLGKGSAQDNINLGTFENQFFPFPPLKDQQTIVRQLDALRAETQKLEAVYQKKIADLEELKKSILQKAFAGEFRGGETVDPKTENVLAIL